MKHWSLKILESGINGERRFQPPGANLCEWREFHWRESDFGDSRFGFGVEAPPRYIIGLDAGRAGHTRTGTRPVSNSCLPASYTIWLYLTYTIAWVSLGFLLNCCRVLVFGFDGFQEIYLVEYEQWLCSFNFWIERGFYFLLRLVEFERVFMHIMWRVDLLGRQLFNSQSSLWLILNRT